jgi:predicted alpha/beta-hydrolase family hydrolase
MRPASGRPGGLLLAPGAGSDREHHTLVAIEAALTPLPVVRMDFPYRKEGRKAPDRAPKLVASVVAEAEAFVAETRMAPGALLLGGRSMGGRMCSMAVAEGLPARGLVLISYPLHPPGRPDKLRVDHLPALEVPCLFVTGTRDPFGTPDELEAATASIPGTVTHHWIEGGRHDLKGADAEISAAVKTWIAGLTRRPRRSGAKAGSADAG